MPVFHDPNATVLALAAGLLGIVFEFHAPGSVLPGAGGATLVLVSAASLMRDTVHPMALLLIGAAIFVPIRAEIRTPRNIRDSRSAPTYRRDLYTDR